MSPAPAACVPRVLHPREHRQLLGAQPMGDISGLSEQWGHRALGRSVLSLLAAVLCASWVLFATKSAAFRVEEVLPHIPAYRRVQEGSLHWKRKGSALREKQFKKREVSAMREEQFIFCCSLFALAFVSTCYLPGAVTFLVLFNPDFPHPSFLVWPLVCRAARSVLRPAVSVCFPLRLCICLSAAQMLPGKAKLFPLELK